MKKLTILLMAICCLAVSCTKDTQEMKNLKEQLAANSNGSELGIDLKYKLISIQFVDTIYYGDTIKYYIDKLDKIWIEPDKEELRHDADFAKRYCNRPYIYNPLDSLAKLTTPIEKYDYNYIKARYTYLYWLCEESRSQGFYLAKNVLDHKDLIKETIAIYDEMKSHAPNDIYGYRINHDYQIFNPLLKCEQKLSEVVTVDKNLVIL